MFRKNLLLLSMNFVLQTKKSELTRSKLILTLQNGILSCNSAKNFNCKFAIDSDNITVYTIVV